ncbi:MAG: ABC transporter substrate-binding protein [Nitrospinota bacterium]
MGKKLRITSEGTVWTLPWDVGIERGYFRDEGIEAEVVKPDSELKPAPVFERPIATDYEVGDLEAYNKCEWGVIKRAADGRRDGWILGKRESVAAMAVLVRGDSPHHRLDDLGDVPVSIQDQTGSHYMTFKMLEGHVPVDRIRVFHEGGPAVRTRSLLSGRVEAATLMEPFISLAERRGCRVLGESRYWGLLYVNREDAEAAREGIFRALRRAVDEINGDLKKHAALLLRDIPEDLIGDFTLEDLRLSRLDYVYPAPYTEAEFNRAADWMTKYGLKADRDPRYADLVKA